MPTTRDNKNDRRGSSYDRRRRKLFLLRTFGDGTQARCWECGAPVTFTTIHVDRIMGGGTYARHNIRPHCKPCSDAQGNEVKRTMTLFKNDTEQDVWIEANCVVRKCYRNPNCPILARGIARDRKPREWDRNTRATQMKDKYKCNAYGSNAPKPQREKDFEDVSMFDVEPGDKNLVPVDGWPDPPIKHSKKDDHA